MSIQHLKIDEITEADLARLVEDRIPESKVLEYKRDLQYVSDDQKREFLCDLTALANTDGGDLILGIKEADGTAAELVGLKKFVPDDALGKIENLLRDFVQPRLTGVHLKVVTLASGDHALIVRVPQSFSAPHVVKHSGISRFCGRNSAGKYDLDVQELRSAFVGNESYGERLKSFRLDRISRILSGGSPVELSGERLIVLHLLPVIGARHENLLGASELSSLRDGILLPPINSAGWEGNYNFDGLLIDSPNRSEGTSRSYVQLMGNGFIESVDSTILQTDGAESPILPAGYLESAIIRVLPQYFEALSKLSLPPPYALSISLLNVRGLQLSNGYSLFFGRHKRPIDRQNLLTREILIDSTDEKPETILRPLFDQIWNACGFERSCNYDESGNWGQR